MPLDPNVVVAAVGTGILPWIGRAIWMMFRSKQGGHQLTREEAREILAAVEQLRKELNRFKDRNRDDIQDIYVAMSKHNELTNQRYEDFYDEFNSHRLKVAASLGINGS